MPRQHDPGGATSRRGRLFPGTMRRQLVVLFIVFSFGPLVISNFWGYRQSRDLLTQAAYRDLSNMSELAAVQTADFVREMERLVASVIAGNDPLRGQVSRIIAGAAMGSTSPARAELSAQLAGRATEVQTVEEQGRQGFELGSGTEPILVVSAPIPDGQGRTLHGHDLDWESDSHGSDASASHAGEGHHIHEAGAEASPAILAQLLAAQEPWQGRYRTAAGEELLAGYHPVPSRSWGVVVEVPVLRALAGLERLRNQAVALSSVMAVVLFVTILLRRTPPARPRRRPLRGSSPHRHSLARPRAVADVLSALRLPSW